MKDNIWRNDEEYMSYVGSLLETKEVQKLANYTQHHFSTRLEHVITVSYVSYRIAKTLGWNAKAVARAGLLHDLFYYDWRTTKFDRGTHAWIHPRIAVRNAEKLTKLSDLEKDIIIKRYGLDGNDEITQKEIAKEMGISRSYVSRIEKRALTKMLREYIKNKNNSY